MLYLYTPTVKRDGRPQLLAKDKLVAVGGFQSVFGYPPDTAKRIREQGNTRRLYNSPLYIEELLIDFDDAPADADKLGEMLRRNKLRHRMYDSGNRSTHYHIDVVPRTSTTLARDVRQWVQLHAPGADLSIYTPTGLFRLPGTWHEKNPGHRKELVINYQGEPLVIPQIEDKRATHYLSSRRGAEEKFLRGLVKRQGAGGRRCYAWYLGKKAADAGVEEGDALERIVRWNSQYCNPPLDLDDIVTKVREAYDE
jgi:hypothetical protein